MNVLHCTIDLFEVIYVHAKQGVRVVRAPGRRPGVPFCRQAMADMLGGPGDGLEHFPRADVLQQVQEMSNRTGMVMNGMDRLENIDCAGTVVNACFAASRPLLLRGIAGLRLRGCRKRMHEPRQRYAGEFMIVRTDHPAEMGIRVFERPVRSRYCHANGYLFDDFREIFFAPVHTDCMVR